MSISCAIIEALLATENQIKTSGALLEHKLTYACAYSSITYSTGAGELWRKVAYKYILDNAPEPVPLNPMHREMIVGQLLRGKEQPKSGYCFMPFSSCDRVDKIDKRALQGLFLAQHEAFLMIKVLTWPCSTQHLFPTSYCILLRWFPEFPSLSYLLYSPFFQFLLWMKCLLTSHKFVAFAFSLSSPSYSLSILSTLSLSTLSPLQVFSSLSLTKFPTIFHFNNSHIIHVNKSHRRTVGSSSASQTCSALCWEWNKYVSHSSLMSLLLQSLSSFLSLSYIYSFLI